MSFTDHISQANVLLRRLRGDTDSPARVIHDLRANGHTVEADAEGKLVVKPKVVPELANRIRKHKDGILESLGVQSPKKFDFWCPEIANELASICLARLECWEWPRTEEVKQLIGTIQDEMDREYNDSNLTAFKHAANKLMKFLDSEPVKTRLGYSNQGSEFAWVLWCQRKTEKQKWVKVTPGIEFRDAIEEFEKTFRDKTGLQTKILAQGEVP